jgi:hypothetical protein
MREIKSNYLVKFVSSEGGESSPFGSTVRGILSLRIFGEAASNHQLRFAALFL